MYVSIGADIAPAMEGFAAVDAGMGSLGASATMAGAAIAALGVGILGFEAKGLLMSAQMDSMFTTIRNNTNMSAGDLETLRQAVLRMGQDTGASFDQLAAGGKKAMNITGDMATSLQILDVAQQSAVSTGADVAQVTNVLANAMHEYGADVGSLAQVHQNAAQYMGIMHQAAAMSNMDLQDFADHSGRAIGVAANLGIPIEQVGAAFVSLTKHGYDAAQAQTQIMNAMTHMINPTKAQQAEIEKLSKATGVDLVGDFSATGLATKGLDGAFADLTTSYERMGFSHAQATGESMKLIAAMRGGLGLATMLGTGAEDYAKALDMLSDKQAVSQLTADSLARTQETAMNQWQVLQRRIEVLMMTVGQALGPAVGAVAEMVRAIVDGFNALPAPVQSAIATFAGVSGALMVLAGGFLLLQPVLAALPAVFAGLAGLALPVAALVAGVMALKQSWDADLGGIQETVGGFVQTIGDLWENGLLPAFKTTAQFLEDRVFPVFGKLAFSILTDVLNVASTLAREWQTVLLPALQATGQFIEEHVFPFFTWLADNVIPLVGQAVQWLADRFNDTFIPAVTAVVGWLTEHLFPIFQWLADNVLPRVGDVLQWLADRWNDTLLPALQATGQFIQERVVPVLSWLADTGLRAIGAAAEWLGGLWSGTLQPVLERFGSFLQSELFPMLGQLAGAIGDKIPVVIGELVDLWGKFVPVLQAFGNVLQTQVLPFVGQLVSAFVDKLEPAFQSLVGWFQALPQPVKDFLATAGAVVAIAVGLAAAFAVIALVVAPVVAAFGAIALPIGAVLGVAGGLLGVIGGIAATLAGIAIPIAIAIGALLLLKTAWENDWLGIQEIAQNVAQGIVTFFTTTLPPALQAFGGFLQTSVLPALNVFVGAVKGAVDAIVSVWNGTLLPLLAGFGDFLQQHWFPYLESLANKYLVDVENAIRTLATVWTTVLGPAIKGVAELLINLEKNVLGGLIEWVTGIARAILDNPVLRAALGGEVSIIQSFVDAVPAALDQATAANNAAAASASTHTQSANVVVNQTNHGVDQSTANQVASGTGDAVFDALLGSFDTGAPAAPATAGGAF